MEKDNRIEAAEEAVGKRSNSKSRQFFLDIPRLDDFDTAKIRTLERLRAKIRKAAETHPAEARGGSPISRFGSFGLRIRNPSIVKPEGMKLERTLRFMIPKKHYEERFGQNFVDMREECNELAQSGDELERRWKSFIYQAGIVFSVVVYASVSILKRIVDMWRLL
ncbi:MAG: hypothetical protein AAGA70_04625 [Pseudomonadota bacterium]